MSEDANVAAAIAGSEEALERLLLAHYDRLLRQIEIRLPQRLRGDLDPEDVLQDVFVQIFRGIGSLHPPTATAFSMWTSRIAENRLLDALRHRHRQKRGGRHRRQVGPASGGSSVFNLLAELEAEGLTASQIVSLDESIRALEEAITRLEADHAEVIRLRYLEELSEQEVAERMGRTPDAVRGLCHRAKKKLRAHLCETSLYFVDEEI